MLPDTDSNLIIKGNVNAYAFATFDHYGCSLITRRTCKLSLLCALECFYDSLTEGKGLLMLRNILSKSAQRAVLL